MRVCILGSGLTALTLAKALVNQKIYVDVFFQSKLTKVFASEKLVKPLPIIQTFIIFLILTIKIR